MIKIDNTLLQEVGLGALPDAEKNAFLKHIYETLEMNVGVRLADQMSNEQLDEFEKYFEAKDDAGAFKWLETNFPNYKEIVQQEFDKLKSEVAQTAPQILAASQAQAAQNPAPAAAPVSSAPQPLGDPTQYGQPAALQQPAPQPQQYQPPAPAPAEPFTPQQQPAPLNDPYQPAQPAVGGSPAPAPEPVVNPAMSLPASSSSIVNVFDMFYMPPS